jgi:hypothetical protein
MFLLGYADNTHLKGYQGRDVVQVGDYFVDTKFGAITDCNSPDFNGVDGIVGFGMPVQHQVCPLHPLKVQKACYDSIAQSSRSLYFSTSTLILTKHHDLHEQYMSSESMCVSIRHASSPHTV